MAKELFYLFSLLCAVVTSLHAEPAESISFVHIGLDDGLSQSTVFDITQDERGNMWFATYNGLNKYDGYDFTVYQHDEKNENSIGGDIIRSLKTDSQGRVWIGTYEGLSLYNADMDSFYNFSYKKNGKKMPVNEIAEINEELLLIYTDKELMLFDVVQQMFIATRLNPKLFTIVPNSVNQQGDNIYIGSDEGLFSYSISQNSLTEVVPEIFKNKQIISVLQESSTQLWVGTEGHGLYLVNPQNGEVKCYSSTTHQLSSNYVRALALDSQNRLWVGTINSLNIYQKETDTFVACKSNPLRKGSLSQTSVRSIYMDSQGGMWLGTFFGGLNYYHPQRNRFKNIQFVPDGSSLNNDIVNCIVEDSRQNLWIGTNSGGVNFYDRKTNTFTYYTVADGLGFNDVKAIYVDEKLNKVYIGTHAGGFSILDRSSGRIETFKNLQPPTIANRSIYAIVPTENGDFWLGTLGGVTRFNPLQKTFTSVIREKNGEPFESTRIVTVFRDSKKRLWFGSEIGLIIYQEEQNELRRLFLLPSDCLLNQRFINCVYESNDGIFWIGTRSGIYRFDENKKAIKQYTVYDGLPNNVVFGILEDSYGKLWISTDKGLSHFESVTEHFRNFTSNDGLQSNQFSASAYCQTSNGEMYFGGINGITVFRPELLQDNPYIPPVTITRLKLFNKNVCPGDDTGILEKDISETGSITLTAEQSMFSLEFVVSNYISGNHNTFAYMLEGYDKEWYYSTTLRTVSYSNLPQGTYQFLVKAANNDGKWNETPTKLEIIILPVWYKTWWAIILFIAAFIIVIICIFRYFWIRKSMETQLQMERMDKERQKEVNEMKLRFFINISHELRTPLTLILAPLQDLMDKISDRWICKQLGHIQRNTNRLLYLVNQLMDYRRAELGVFELKVRRNLIHQVIEKNFIFYDRVAQRKSITYNFYSELEGREILCDPNYLELIVNNLLSNAFKYTDEGQSIVVNLKEENAQLVLQVMDTGSGIPIDKQGRIFERFYQVDNEHLGSGIGLSLVQRLVELHHGCIELESQEGKGSCFTIYLPTAESVYSKEEMSEGAISEDGRQVYATNEREMYIVGTEKVEDAETMDEGERRKENLLIVEDNIDILQYLSDELGKTYHIFKAENGEEALAVVKEQEIALILTDIMMPVMSGLQLCKQIKQNLNTCHIPVIILSAKADLKEQLEGLQVGADDYIPKPFSLLVVSTKIKNLFRTRYRAIDYYSKSLEIEPEKVALNSMDEELLKRAVEVVEKHIDDVEFSTEEFAREMFMSRSNLHLKMKALTGESTNDFIRKIRFNHACKLLKEGRYTVSEISMMVGFSSSSYFATSFKKYFGYMPSEYVKMQFSGKS